jgi:Putative auto-transporter adhesin, head GIN domain
LGFYVNSNYQTLFKVRRGGIVMKKILLVLMIAHLLLSGCSVLPFNRQTVKGSGILASETRPVSGFDAIELASSADVRITFGDAETLSVEAEDNLLPLIQTRVRGDTLVIDFKPNTTVETTESIRVTVTMKSLTAASLPGSGNITISGLNGGKVKVDLPGSGNITADGVVDSVNATLAGSGNILCGDLQAKSAWVRLDGSGNITVFASENLDASLNGSGNVNYRGNPGTIKTSGSNSSNIQAED